MTVSLKSMSISYVKAADELDGHASKLVRALAHGKLVDNSAACSHLCNGHLLTRLGLTVQGNRYVSHMSTKTTSG